MSKHIFCRDVCIKREEPLAGTGSAAKRYILLHWPRAYWRVPRTQSYAMPPELADAITTANAAGLHVALVDGDDIALSCDNINITQIDPQKAAQLICELAAGAMLKGEPDNRITIVCCTDAKQDPCCARYGFATWKALKAQADPQYFRVLQSTHLGGCRFAASVIVLPQRARYSRLQPENIVSFLEHIKNGKPFLPAYRGNPELDALLQVAEHATLTWAQSKGVSGDVSFPLPPVEPFDSKSITIDTEITGYMLEISLQKTSFPLNTRCITLKNESDPTQIMRWSAVDIRMKA